jgi:hypothetical protein
MNSVKNEQCKNKKNNNIVYRLLFIKTKSQNNIEIFHLFFRYIVITQIYGLNHKYV